jgi:hypothetical protein
MGRKKMLLADWRVPFQAAYPGTLRDLIAHVVRSEVAAFHERQGERRLTRVLTLSQIEWAAAQGKIEMGGSDLDQPVNPDAAVAAALQAFEDGLYLVFIDTQPVAQLDAPVAFHADSRVSFVRLTLLAGG